MASCCSFFIISIFKTVFLFNTVLIIYISFNSFTLYINYYFNILNYINNYILTIFTGNIVYKIKNMPIKQEQTRAYKIEDANLITMSKTKIAYMRRDLVKLAEFGITAAMLTALETQINAFEAFATDRELIGMQELATENKDAKALELRDALEPIRVRAETKYGYGTAKYKTFGIGEISRWDDANLLIVRRRVVRVGTIYLADLAPLGLTAAMLSSLTTICNDFENLIISQGIKIGERDITQEDRVEMGNGIFVQLKNYCRLAKTAWRTLDAAKYNDYLIYDSPSGTAAEGLPPLTDPIPEDLQ